LMGNPELILIDEPTEGLAPKIVEVVDDMIRGINKQGTTILLSDQKFAIALGLAHRVYLISKGMIQWEGTSEDLGHNEEVRKKYLEV